MIPVEFKPPLSLAEKMATITVLQESKIGQC